MSVVAVDIAIAVASVASSSLSRRDYRHSNITVVVAVTISNARSTYKLCAGATPSSQTVWLLCCI